jgi:hypothetical protein
MNEAGKPIFIITNDLAQYAIKHVQGNAELIGKKRRFGFNFYVNKGLSDVHDPETYKRKEATMNPVPNGNGFYKNSYVGADAKFYPHIDVKKFKYYYSFGLEKGEAYCRIEKQVTVPHNYWAPIGGGWYQYTYGTSTSISVNYFSNPFWGFHHKEGCLWTITNWLFLEAEINVGVNRFIEPETDSEGKKHRSTSIKFGGGLHLGFAL